MDFNYPAYGLICKGLIVKALHREIEKISCVTQDPFDSEVLSVLLENQRNSLLHQLYMGTPADWKFEDECHS